jgi:hypothetical protein
MVEPAAAGQGLVRNLVRAVQHVGAGVAEEDERALPVGAERDEGEPRAGRRVEAQEAGVHPGRRHGFR